MHPLSHYTSLFIFNRYRRHRHLHSFPTRRSSDLVQRLAQELRSRIERRAQTLTGRCPADEAATPLEPLYELVRGAAGEVSVPALTKLLAGEPDARELADALCSALGARETDEPPELFWAFRRLFETLARRGPTVVFLEDLH